MSTTNNNNNNKDKGQKRERAAGQKKTKSGYPCHNVEAQEGDLFAHLGVGAETPPSRYWETKVMNGLQEPQSGSLVN